MPSGDNSGLTGCMLSYGIEALRKTYEDDGVVFIPNLVEEDWVNRLQITLDRFLTKDPGSGNSKNFGHGPGRTTVRWMFREEPEILRFAKESGIAPTIAGVIGTRSLRFWYDNTFIQEAGFKNAELAGSPYHSDASVFPFNGEQNPSVWVALTPVLKDTAPLTCLRGSHKTRLRYRPPVYERKGVPLPDGFSEAPDWESQVASGEWEEVWYEMEPGDTLLIHPDTIHGAPPASDEAPKRIGFSSRWAGDDVRWYKHDFAMDIPDLDYESVANGSALSGELFPLVWESS